jgi:hypothetical protein
MPLYIKNSDGTSLTVVQDGNVDTSTSLILPGKAYPLFAQAFSQNFVSLLENFASQTAPSNPQTGQLWFNNVTNSLNIWYQNAWYGIAGLNTSQPTNPADGTLWWDTVNSQLKVYSASTVTWTIIGPNTNQTGTLVVNGNTPFNLVIGGNKVMTIGTTGIVSQPFQPTGAGIGRQATGNLSTSGLLQPVPWVPQYVTINNNNCFSAATGIFVAPVAGVYSVAGQVQTLGGTTAGSHMISFWKNASDVGMTSINYHDNTEKHMLNCSGLIQCTVDDTISMVAATDIGCTIGNAYANINIGLVG